MVPEDMYVMAPSGCVLYCPSPKPYPNKPPKCSDCAPLFMKVHNFFTVFLDCHQLLNQTKSSPFYVLFECFFWLHLLCIFVN